MLALHPDPAGILVVRVTPTPKAAEDLRRQFGQFSSAAAELGAEAAIYLSQGTASAVAAAEQPYLHGVTARQTTIHAFSGC